MDGPEIREGVFLELDEMISKLEQELSIFEKEITNPEHIDVIFRYVHTIKGNAGMLDCSIFITLAHRFEDFLGLVKEGEIIIQKEMFPLFYTIHSVMGKMYKKLKNNKEVNINIDNILKQLSELIEKGETVSTIEDEEEDIIEEINKEFTEAEAIRVDLNKIDNLVNLLGDMHLTHKMHTQLLHVFNNFIFASENIQKSGPLDLMSRELEEKILKFSQLFDIFRHDLLNIRMVKISNLFNRFPKMVRDLSNKLNKKIKITFEGEENEIDKRVLEEASDPLLHIIRNAVDHGIELPEERIKKGKDEKGAILIKTYPQGGNIIIEISDDGKGIDPDTIKEKLIQKEIFSENNLQTMPEKEIINSIFISGFSTKEDISDLSGRGVGMDVVAEKVKNLRGEVEIISQKGKGSTFKIILPMTLSIVEGLSVSVKEEEYIFLKDDVKFMLKLPRSSLQTIGNKSIIDYGDTVIPIYNLKNIFNLKDESRIKRPIMNIVVLFHKDNLYGFEVDKLNGLKSIVLKNIGTHIKNLGLFEGTTINETGNSTLVISKSGIIERGIKDIRE